MTIQAPQKSTKNPFYNVFHSFIILIGLAIVFNACEGCGCKNPNKDLDTNGKLEISVDKTTLQDKPHSQERIFKLLTKLPDNTQPNVVAQIKNFSLRVEVKATGGMAGTNKIKYTSHDESGNSTEATLTDGNTKTEPIQHFFKTTKEGYIEFKETLEEPFEIVPGNEEVTKIQVIFQLLDQNGSNLGDAHTVTWESGPRLILTIDPTTLDGEFVDSKKKNGVFTVNITKQGNGGVEEDLQISELNNLYILATPSNGTASLDGGNFQKLDGTKPAKLKQINPGAPIKQSVELSLRAIKRRGETVLSLALAEEKDGLPVPITIPKTVKIHSLPKVRLELDSPNVLQGKNKKIKIKIIPEDSIAIQDLKNIELIYTITSDLPATTPKAQLPQLTENKSVIDTYKKTLNELTDLNIVDLSKKKPATISFTINTQKATSVLINGIRLSNTETENDAGYYIESINWCVAPVKLSLAGGDPNKRDFYGSNEEDISFTITTANNISAAEAGAIKFSYNSSPIGAGPKASLQYETIAGGGNWQEANNVDLATLLRLGGVELPKGNRLLTLKVTHADDNNPVETEFKDIKLDNSNEKISSIRWYNPDVTLSLVNQSIRVGYHQNSLRATLTLKNTAALTQKDLNRLRLHYPPTKTYSELAYEDKGGNKNNANNQPLAMLLDKPAVGMDQETAFTLYIKPDDKDETYAEFNDIHITNSHSNKSVSLQWVKPDVQIRLEANVDSQVYGFDEKHGNIYIKKVPVIIAVGDHPLEHGDLDSLHLEFEYNPAYTNVKLLSGAELPLKKHGATYQISLRDIGIPNGATNQSFKLAFAIEKDKNIPNSFDPFTIKNIKINGASKNNKADRSIPKIDWKQPLMGLSLAENNIRRIGYSDKSFQKDGKSKDRGRFVTLKITNPMKLSPINYEIIRINYINTKDGETLNLGMQDINNKTLTEIILHLPKKHTPDNFDIPVVINNNNLTNAKFTNIQLTNCSGPNTNIPQLLWEAPMVGLEIVGSNKTDNISEALTIQITPRCKLFKEDLENIMFHCGLTANDHGLNYYIESMESDNSFKYRLTPGLSISLHKLLNQNTLAANIPITIWLKPRSDNPFNKGHKIIMQNIVLTNTTYGLNTQNSPLDPQADLYPYELFSTNPLDYVSGHPIELTWEAS